VAASEPSVEVAMYSLTCEAEVAALIHLKHVTVLRIAVAEGKGADGGGDGELEMEKMVRGRL